MSRPEQRPASNSDARKRLEDAQRCNHACDPADAETSRFPATHFLDCPVWTALGVTNRGAL